MSNAQNAISEYDARVNTWLEAHGITYSVQFLRSGPMKWDVEEAKRTGKQAAERDIYRATFTREGRQPLIIAEFGQSLAQSRGDGKCTLRACGVQYGETSRHRAGCEAQKKGMPPSAYDVLACVEKYRPGSFTEWCSEYGCDTDSRSAFATWEAVHDEYSRVARFFTAEELSELQEVAQ